MVESLEFWAESKEWGELEYTPAVGLPFLSADDAEKFFLRNKEVFKLLDCRIVKKNLDGRALAFSYPIIGHGLLYTP